MGRRRANRLNLELPVSVSGFDANGNPFVRSAKTVDVSRWGMRVNGIQCARGPGDILRVQYKEKRGRYRIIWMEKESGTLGMEGVEGAQGMFGDQLPASAGTDVAVDTYSLPQAAGAAASATNGTERRAADRREGERRRHKRYNCAGIASVREPNREFGAEGRVLDISRCGCYVEMMSPLRVGTPVHLEIRLNNFGLNLPAIVRVSQANMGMGLEFTDVPPGELEELDQALAELSGKAPAPATSASPAPPAPAGPPEAEQVGSAVLRWFATHDQLTREEFQKLVQDDW